MTGQDFQLLAAAAENEGVAALEADDAPVFLGQLDQEIVDFVLGQGVLGGFLAGVDDLGAGLGQVQDAVADEMVINQDIRLADEAGRPQGQQIGVAGAAANQIDGAGRAEGLRFGSGMSIRFFSLGCGA